MRVTYDLRKHAAKIEQIQNATLNSEDFGIQQTHGLFGSDEWWAKITSGELKTHRLRGTISKVYMGSMGGDWPMLEVTDNFGKKSRWTREVNQAEDGLLYVKGKKVEIDYVIQKFKEKSYLGGSETECVIQIRVEE